MMDDAWPGLFALPTSSLLQTNIDFLHQGLEEVPNLKRGHTFLSHQRAYSFPGSLGSTIQGIWLLKILL